MSVLPLAACGGGGGSGTPGGGNTPAPAPALPAEDAPPVSKVDEVNADDVHAETVSIDSTTKLHELVYLVFDGKKVLINWLFIF